MQIGEKFPVPVNAQESVRRLAWKMGQQLEMKFSVRKLPNGLHECRRIA